MYLSCTFGITLLSQVHIVQGRHGWQDPQGPQGLGLAWIFHNRKPSLPKIGCGGPAVEVQFTVFLLYFLCTLTTYFCRVFGKKFFFWDVLYTANIQKIQFFLCPDFHCTFGIHCSGCTVYSVLLYFLCTVFLLYVFAVYYWKKFFIFWEDFAAIIHCCNFFQPFWHFFSNFQ